MDELRPDPNWYTWLPFAALMARNSAPNRPLLTRILEQSLVAFIAGGLAAYVAIQVTNAVQDVQIKAVQEQLHASETRVTDELKEIRLMLYQRATSSK